MMMTTTTWILVIKQIIDKRVAKVLTPYIQKQMQEEDANEISEFVAKNPDFAPYADKLRSTPSTLHVKICLLRHFSTK